MGNRDEKIQFVVDTVGAKDVDALSQSFTAVGDAAAKADPKAQALVDEFNNLREATKAVQSLASLKAQLQETGDKLFLAKRGLADLNAQFSATDRSSGAVSKAFKAAEKAVSDLTAKERELDVAVQKASGTIAKHGLDVNNLTKAEQTLQERTRATVQAMREYAASTEGAAAGTKKVERSIENAYGGFARLREGANNAVASLLRVTGIAGAVSTALGALGVGRFFGGAVSSATEFEAKLSEIRAVSGATSEQLARMKRAAEDATKTTKFSAAEAADALGELARASGDADAAIAQLAPTLNLAQAAGIGTAESAQILTTTLTQFGLAADQAGRAADVFAREANSTNDTVSSLGLAMSYTAPLARQLGLTLEQTTSILGALAQEGFKGERAGTALRNVFSQLLDPTSKFRGELRGLNITGNDFGEIVTKLAAAGDKGKKAILALDSEARPAILALVESGGKNIQRLIEDFQRASGEAERTAKTMGDNFGGATARLTSAFDTLRRALIDPILEPLKVQFDAAAERIRAFVETAQFERIKNAIKDFALSATDAIVQFVGALDFEAVSKKIQDFGRDAVAFFTSFKENAAGFVGVLSTIANSISLVFNGIQTVVLAFATIITGAFKLALQGVQKFLEGLALIPGAGRLVSGALEEVKGAVGGLNAVMEEFAKRTNENAKQTQEAADKLGGALERMASGADAAAPAAKRLGTAGEKAAEGVDKFGTALGYVPEYALGAGEGVRALLAPLGDAKVATEGVAAAMDSAGQAAQRFGGGPITEAEAKLRAAEGALSALVIAGNATPAALQAAARGVRIANEELERTKRAAAAGKSGIDDLKGAYSDLGIKSQEELAKLASDAKLNFERIKASSDQTTAGLADQRNAFAAYAKLALDAVAQADAGTKAQTASQLRAQAAALGLSTQIEALIAQYKTLGQVSGGTNQQLQQAGDTGRRAFEGTKEAAKGAGDAIKDAGKQAEAVVVSFATIGQASFKAVADLYSLVLARKASARDLEILIKTAEERLVAQRAQVDATVVAYNNLDAAALRAMSQAAGGADNAASNLRQMAAEAREGKSAFDELGKEDLSELASAADRAAQELARIAEEARSAKAELSDLGREFADQIDQIKGDERAIENRKFQEDLARIAELAKRSGDANSAEANQARAQAEELHRLRMEQIQKEEAERRRQQDGDSEPAPPRPPTRPNGGGNGGGSGGAAQPAVTINFNGAFVGDADSFVREITKRQRELFKKGF